MTHTTNREKILIEGLRLVRRLGYGRASVREIVRAAGVPLGSFTNNFASKEVFSLEILDLDFEETRASLADTLLNDGLPPLARLELYVDRCAGGDGGSMHEGNLVGSYAVEAAKQSEAIRRRVQTIYTEIGEALAYCLSAAVRAHELSPDFDVGGVAGYIVSSLQGADVVDRAYRDHSSYRRFKRILFSKVLC